MTRFVLTLVALALLAGCAAFPDRPAVDWYNNPSPMLIPQAPDVRPGMRALTPAPVPAPLCLTDADHLALDAYLDQIDAWRTRRGY